MKVFILLFFITYLSIQPLFADRSRQALRAIEKEEYEKANEYLLRSYSKDSLNPLVFYSYCHLYVAPNYELYNLDTAKFFINTAFSLLPNKNEEHEGEMDKAGVLLEHFDTLNQYIDSLGFVLAKANHSIESYNEFILKFGQSDQFEIAVQKRDTLRYDKVKLQNTWQAYYDFITETPEANQSIAARSKYHELIYHERTSQASTQDLESFLIDVPETPYRLEVEQEIFRSKVSSLNIDSIGAFVHRYANDSLIKSAMGILYHWGKLNEVNWPSEPDDTYQVFMDSVAFVERLNEFVLVPFYENGLYTYHSLNDSISMPSMYDVIDSRHFCGNVTDDVLMVEQEDERKLINRRGDVIFEGALETYDDLGGGVVRIRVNGFFGAVHKSGYEILPPIYDDIRLEGDHMLIIEKDGLAGLASIVGQIYLSPVYDQVYPLDGFWIIRNEEVLAVSSLNAILNDLVDDPIFKYEEVELLNEEYVVGYLEDSEEVINTNLEIISPIGTNQALTRYDQWVFRTMEGNYLFDSVAKQLSDQVYQRIIQNDQWIGLYNGFKWTVFNQKNIDDQPILNVDSLKLVGSDIVVVFRDHLGTTIFPNGKLIEIEEGQFIQSLSTTNHTVSNYLVLEYRGKLRLYEDGEFLFETTYDEIGYISESEFSVKLGNKYGVVDRQGKLILRTKYDAIKEAIDGVSDILYHGKFGAYNFEDRVLVDLESEQLLGRYNESVLIQKKEGKLGLRSTTNELLREPIFEEINYFTDSSYLAKSDDKWSLYSFSDHEELLGQIDSYSYLIDTDSLKVIEFQKGGHYGIYDVQKGELIPPVYNDIYNLGSEKTPLYLGEKSFYEADYYVVAYYDSNGVMIRSMAYRGQDYESIVCDN